MDVDGSSVQRWTTHVARPPTRRAYAAVVLELEEKRDARGKLTVRAPRTTTGTLLTIPLRRGHGERARRIRRRRGMSAHIAVHVPGDLTTADHARATTEHCQCRLVAARCHCVDVHRLLDTRRPTSVGCAAWGAAQILRRLVDKPQYDTDIRTLVVEIVTRTQGRVLHDTHDFFLCIRHRGVPDLPRTIILRFLLGQAFMKTAAACTWRS